MSVTKQPQAISKKTWEAIKLACVSGMGFSEAARAFGINNAHTVIMKARRNHWPIPTRVQERAQALQEGRYKAQKLAQELARERNGNGDQALEVLAEDWASKGERHRSLTFDLAHSSLRAAAKAGLPVTDWAEAEKADRMARRSAGLDSEEGSRIQIGLDLVCARLDACELPKDALPGMPGCEPQGFPVGSRSAGA
jgi:hypothetical protein